MKVYSPMTRIYLSKAAKWHVFRTLIQGISFVLSCSVLVLINLSFFSLYCFVLFCFNLLFFSHPQARVKALGTGCTLVCLFGRFSLHMGKRHDYSSTKIHNHNLCHPSSGAVSWACNTRPTSCNHPSLCFLSRPVAVLFS